MTPAPCEAQGFGGAHPEGLCEFSGGSESPASQLGGLPPTLPECCALQAEWKRGREARGQLRPLPASPHLRPLSRPGRCTQLYPRTPVSVCTWGLAVNE